MKVSLSDFILLTMAPKQSPLQSVTASGAATRNERSPNSSPPTSHTGHFLIIQALRDSKPSVALQLLEASPQHWTACDYDGHTLLHWAALLGDSKFVALALSHNCPADAKSRNKQTPLMWAMSQGHVAVAEQLLSADADAQSADRNGATPLTIAAQLPGSTLYQLMKLLRQRGPQESSGASDIAVTSGHTGCASLGLRDAAKVTPDAQSSEVVASLCPSEERFEDVFEAVRERKPELALDLLEACPNNWTKCDLYGNSLLHWGALLGDRFFVSMALDNQCPADARSNNEQTPLMWAITKGNVKVVRQLLEAGADIRIADSLGATPLMIAVQHKSSARYQLMLLMLERSTEEIMKDADCNGCTAAHWAAYKGDLTSLKLLAEFKANLQATDDANMLPLHRAVYAHQADVIRFLIESRSDPSEKIADGRTCFELAEDDEFMVALLRGPIQIDDVEGGANSGGALNVLSTSWLVPYVDHARKMLDAGNCKAPAQDLQMFEDMLNAGIGSCLAPQDLKAFEDTVEESGGLLKSSEEPYRESYLV